MWLFATAVFLVLVFFLYRHPRTTWKAIGSVLAVVVGVVGLMIYADNNRRTNAPAAPAYIDRNSQVHITVEYGTASCDEAHPLRVFIANRADKILERVEWYVAAYVPGRSSDIAQYQPTPYTSDHILDPDRAISLCFQAPKLKEAEDPKQLRWEAELARPVFRY